MEPRDVSAASVIDSQFIGRGDLRASDRATPTLEGNRLSGGTRIVLDGAGADGIVRNNTIVGTDSVGITMAGGRGDYVIDGNTIVGALTTGIWSQGVRAAVITANTISGSQIALRLSGDESTVSGNELSDNVTAISLDDRSVARLEGNTFCGNTVDLMIEGEASEIDPSIDEVCEDDGS